MTLSQEGLARIRLTCATGEIGLHFLLYGSREREKSGRISDFIQFLAREAWPPADPLSESGVIFSSGDPQHPGTSWPLKFERVGAWNALSCAPKGEGPATLEIVPPASSEHVVLVVSHPSATLSNSGIRQGWPGNHYDAPTGVHRVALDRDAVARGPCAHPADLRNGEIGLHFLFHGAREPARGPQQTVRMIAKDAGVIVAETTISGRPGDVVTGEVNADRITAVEFLPLATVPAPANQPDKISPAPPAPRQDAAAGPVMAPAPVTPVVPGAPIKPPETGHGYAALIDLCWDTVVNALHGRWERIANFPYPMGLPVAEPSYPCVGKPATQVSAEAVALSRVRYGTPASWGGPRFTELHAILTKLVVGGSGGAAMSDRTEKFVDTTLDPDSTPQLPDQNLLQLLQLAALDPAMAQILGLYWVDEAAVPGQPYDYAVLADHDNKFAGQAGPALAALNQQIPNGVDAWITFNHVVQPRPPLSAPAGPRAVVLPDTAVDGAAGVGRGAIGLRWDIPSLALGYLRPDAAVRYLIWRSAHGQNAPIIPAAASTYLPLNLDAPALAGSATGTSLSHVPANWPPFPLDSVDRPLAEGWYSYGISGIDIWGRYSGLSNPAEWRQWAPAPQPEPWYYQHPVADRQLHAFAVRILDKTPPPPPAAVEATALDPDDDLTYVRDGDYTAWWTQSGAPWWNGLTDAQRAAVMPLRVRWRWYPAQQDQHPNTREFRIYFNPNSAAPEPDRFDPLNWQERIFVCDYNDHVSLVAAGVDDGPCRQYEVLLPVPLPSGSPVFSGVPLQPTLAAPIVYANISVSAADDRTHTSDHAKWNATPWGGRSGNESVLAAPAKIYRVWRTPPPAPLSLINDERVWATKADYHSHSFYTFRWPASAGLKAHVYSVLDGTLFMIERLREDIAALSAADTAALQTIWNPVPQSVVDQIAGLRALKAAVSNAGTPSDAVRKQNDAAWGAACAALADNTLRGLAALPLHEDSFVRATTSPVDDPDFAGPDDPAGYAPNALWRAYKAMFDGRAVNRYFLRVSYIDNAHNEGPLGPPSPPIYLPPAVPPRTPVIVKVTGGDRQATVAWTTANAEAGGRYTLYRTDNDYRLRDVRLMDRVLEISSTSLNPTFTKAEWTDANGLKGGQTYHYCLVFTDMDGNPSAPSKPVAVNVVDTTVPNPPAWTEQTWLLERASDQVLLDWPEDGVVPAGHSPVLRLSWVTDVQEPVFVLTRRERYGRVWTAPTGTEQITASAPGAGEYSWIERNADPGKLWEYRLRVRALTGVWSTEYDVLSVGRPDLVEAG